MMKTTLKLEELVMFIFSAYLSYQLPFPGWLYWALFLTPDVSMLGYLINPSMGALSYNVFHHKGLALLIYLTGLLISNPLIPFIGLLLFGHSSFDRLMGYGLKYSDNFKNTHLGFIGPKS